MAKRTTGGDKLGDAAQRFQAPDASLKISGAGNVRKTNAAELGYEPMASAPDMRVEYERRVELGYEPTLTTPDMAIEQTTVADGAVEHSPDSRERRELALVFGGLMIGVVALGNVLGWLYIGSPD